MNAICKCGHKLDAFDRRCEVCGHDIVNLGILGGQTKTLLSQDGKYHDYDTRPLVFNNIVSAMYYALCAKLDNIQIVAI